MEAKPVAWIEVDEDQTGRPLWKAAHLSADAINGEHRCVPLVTLDQMRAAVLAERERIAMMAAVNAADAWGRSSARETAMWRDFVTAIRKGA